MPTTPPKTPFRCPVCGFVQLESPSLVSTNCRSCGAHYEATAQDKVRAGGETALPTFAGKKTADGRTVHCLKCGRSHDVSRKAQSTICPGCYAPIELIDVSVNERTSRAVDTRGHLNLGPKGIIGNQWIVCGSARIEGAFTGHLRCEGEARLAMEEHHMAGCMARGVDHLEGLLPEAHGVAIDQPAIGLEGGERRKAESMPLAGQLVDPELVVDVRALERHAMAFREFGRLAAMVDVAVGEEDLLQPHTELAQGVIDLIEITARIEGRGRAAARAHQQRAVLLEGGHRHDGQLQRRGVRVLVCEANPRVRGKLVKAGLFETLPAADCVEDLPQALARAVS